MSEPAIKAALEHGAQALCRWPDGMSCNPSAPSPSCQACFHGAAQIIAAFLRAIPEGASIPTGRGDLRARIGPMPALAAAVERAAREAADD